MECTELKLENKGNCLFCKVTAVKEHSLRTLLQYLQMMEVEVEVKVEPGARERANFITMDLGASEVKAGLCEECGNHLETFLKAKEGLEMAIRACLAPIQSKMKVGSEKTDAATEYPIQEGTIVKEALRRLGKTQPRVVPENLHVLETCDEPPVVVKIEEDEQEEMTEDSSSTRDLRSSTRFEIDEDVNGTDNDGSTSNDLVNANSEDALLSTEEVREESLPQAHSSSKKRKRPSSNSDSSESNPTKGSDEEFILGLSPARSPVKTMPSPSQAVTTTTVSSSASSNIAPKLSQTPHMAGQGVGALQIVQITHPGGLKTLQVIGQIPLPPNFLPDCIQIIGSGNRPTTPSSSGSIVIGGGSSPIVINTSTHQGSPGSIILSNSASNPSDRSGPARQGIILTSKDISQLSDSNRPAFSITEVNGIQMLTAIKPSNLLTPNALQKLPSQFPLTTQAVTQVQPVSLTASSTATAAGLVRSPVTGTTEIITKTKPPGIRIVRTPLSTSSSTTRPIILRTKMMTQTSQSTPTSSKVPAATTPSTPNPSALSSPLASKRKQEGCRCGNATPTPGRLTCLGQRCVCYAERTACLDCKCKGCKNPYMTLGQGQKLLQNTRALIDPNQMSVLTSPITTGGPQNSPVQLIPIRYSQPENYSPQIIQFASAQGIKSLPMFISSAGGHILIEG